MSALGRLSIAVEADIANFTSDMGKAERVAKRTAGEIDRSLRRSFAAMGVAAGAAALAIGSAVRSSINAADQMAKMAQKVGVSVEALSGLKFAADQTGVSMEQLQGGLVKLARTAADAAGGLKAQQAVFKSMGVSVVDAAGKLRGTEAILLDVAEAFKGYQDGAAKTALATRVFGRAGAELIPLLNNGRAGIEALTREARELGLVIGTDAAKSAEVFNDNLSKLRDAVSGVGNDLMNAFLPALVEVTNATVAWVKQLRESGAIEKFVAGIRAIIGALDDLVVFMVARFAAGAALKFVASLTLMTAGLGAAAAASAVFKGVLAALGGPIGLVLTGVALLVTTIYNLGTAQSEASRATQIFAEATTNAAQAADAMAGATRDQIQTQMAGLEATRGMIQQQLDLAEANLTVAASEAEITRQRMQAADPFATYGGGAPIQDTGGNIAGVTAEVERLRGALFQTDETWRRLQAALSERPDQRTGAPLVDLTDSAGKAGEELARLREQAEAFANQTIMAMLQQFDPLLAIQLRYEESLRTFAPLLTGTVEQQKLHAEAVEALTRSMEAEVVATQKQIAETKRQQNVVGLLAAAYAEEAMVMRMSGRAAFVYAETQRAIGDAINANRPLMADQIELIGQMAGAMYDSRESFEQVNELLEEFVGDGSDSPILKLVSDMQTLQDELAKVSDSMGEAFDPDRSEKLRLAIERMNTQIQVEAVGGFRAMLGAAQAFTKEGSKGFQAMEVGMAALSIIQDVLALKAAVTAVLSQGAAPPPISFAAMAAMAAAVAPLLASIGVTMSSFSGSGGGSTVSPDRQAAQGTGSVLGDADAKSESIANAIQITADATSRLVGISRGMLNALRAMQAGISGAAAGISRMEFGEINLDEAAFANAFGPLWTIGGALLGSIFGGAQELVDQGLVIRGGSFGAVSSNPRASSYQTVETDGGWFGSDDIDDRLEALGASAISQIRLILTSIGDAVREGAIALGLDAEEVTAAIEAYRLEEIRISTMDLTGEEAQAELEAVFGQIFDGLAEHVVPFIGQFQQVGEGLGETLVRVATSVQVVQEAMRYLGLAIKETDPERFAQISVGLIEMAGGIEEFINGMMAFADAFAPDDFQFLAAQSALRDAFTEAGLKIPATRDAMWELMQSLDATTEAGQAQIAMLLSITDTADAYYTELERQAAAADKAAMALQDLNQLLYELSFDGFSGPVQSVIDLNNQYQQHIQTIHDLAAAAGRAKVSQLELGIATQWYQRQLRALAAEMRQAALGIAAQLGYITEQGGESGAYGAEMGGIREVEAAVEDRYARELQLLAQLDQYVRSLGISALSPLTPAERLGEAEAEYLRLLGLAQGGDLEALEQLQAAANAYLGEAQSYFGGVGAYEGIFDSVRDALRGLVDRGPLSTPMEPTPVYGGPVTVEPGAGWAEQNAIERALLAQQLVDYIGALALAMGQTSLQIMEELGIPLEQLVADLGINLQNISGAAVEALAQLAMDLGLPLGELVAALGLELPDLAAGVRELATSLGIDLTAMTAATATSLAQLATSLGVDLLDLTTALGIDLGALTDANSPIFLALTDLIDQLSPDIRDELEDLLDAIANATTEADANAAINAASAYINSLPAGIRNALAPYFQDVFPAGALTDLDYLQTIDTTAVSIDTQMRLANVKFDDMVGHLANIADSVSSDAPDMVSALMNTDMLAANDDRIEATEDLGRKLDALTRQNGELLTSIARSNERLYQLEQKRQGMGGRG